MSLRRSRILCFGPPLAAPFPVNRRTTGVPDRQTFLTNVARISACLWLFTVLQILYDYSKRASRALLWDCVMIMGIYRLNTRHRSFSHLYDATHDKCSTLLSTPSSSELGFFLFVLSERSSCLLHMDLLMQTNTININGSLPIIGSSHMA